jgi:hypothetical protein
MRADLSGFFDRHTGFGFQLSLGRTPVLQFPMARDMQESITVAGTFQNDKAR